MHSYILAGLTIQSEFPLPELLPHSLAGARPDIEIRCGPVPDSLPGAIQSIPEAQTTPDAVLLVIPTVGRFCVRAGREIRVQPDPNATAEDLRLFLLGSAFGAIYFQRGDFPLHASVVVINGVMIILVIGNLAQLSIWAGLFLLLGEFDTMQAALYHSAVNFATLGYGDIVMSEEYKFLGPLEAINGVLMIGASTAALTAAFQDAMRKTIHARHR